MRTVKGTIGAYITDFSSLHMGNLETVKEESLIDHLTYCKFVDDKLPEGWIKVGSVEVIVTMFDNKKINKAQIATLREMKKTVQAEAQKKITEIEQQIQSLLAIEG